MEIQTTKELMRRYATVEGHIKKFNNQIWVSKKDLIEFTELNCGDIEFIYQLKDVIDKKGEKYWCQTEGIHIPKRKKSKS